MQASPDPAARSSPCPPISSSGSLPLLAVSAEQTPPGKVGMGVMFPPVPSSSLLAPLCSAPSSGCSFSLVWAGWEWEAFLLGWESPPGLLLPRERA